MRIVGIDPGVQPVLCLRDTAANTATFFEETAVKVKRNKTFKTEPVAGLIAAKIIDWQPDLVIVEAVTPMGPRKEGRAQGLGSTGAFMRARGMLEGIVAALGYPLDTPAPVTWTKRMGVRGGPEGIRLKAIEMFPAHREDLKLKKHHNRAAALMLAMYGERHVAPSHPLL